MSLLPHIEDAFRAARHEAERDSHDDDRPDPADYADLGHTVEPDPCDCGACLVCALRARRRG